MKFITKDMREAAKDNWPSSGDIEDWNRYELRIGLYACDEAGKPIHLLGIDGGEPEDQSFCRDWDWVPREMNRLADKIREAETESEKAEAVLEATEKALKTCESCRGRLTFNSCNSGGIQLCATNNDVECPLASVRQAWMNLNLKEKGKK